MALYISDMSANYIFWVDTGSTDISVGTISANNVSDDTLSGVVGVTRMLAKHFVKRISIL